jgi:hypothetical protein
VSAAQPKARSWYLPVLTFVLAGPLAFGIAMMLGAWILTAIFFGASPPSLETVRETPLVLLAAYGFGIVPFALTGYFHFYARSWLRPNIARTLATCALGAALGAILPAIQGSSFVIVTYAFAGAIAAGVCVALTAKLFPVSPDGLPPSPTA